MFYYGSLNVKTVQEDLGLKKEQKGHMDGLQCCVLVAL